MMLKGLFTLLVCGGVGVSMLGCVITRYKEFGGVKPGMEKDLVLQAAGNPDVSRRWHGKDRWIYEYQTSPNGPQTREVHFENGKAVYVGEKVVPAVSAAQQDRLNEESNQQEEARVRTENNEWENQLGVAHTQFKSRDKSTDATTGVNRRSDRIDRRLQESMYGTRNLEVERKKLAPNFEAVE